MTRSSCEQWLERWHSIAFAAAHRPSYCGGPVSRSVFAYGSFLLEFIVEESSDLLSWTEATTEHIGSESDGEIATITVRIPAPEAGVPIRRFARVAARPKSL